LRGRDPSRRTSREFDGSGREERSEATDQLGIGEVVGIGPIGQVDHVNIDGGGEEVGAADGGVAPGGIAVEQEHDSGGIAKEGALRLEELRAKESNRREADLCQAHRTPGALDDGEPAERLWQGAVRIVEEVPLGEAGWQLPLTESAGFVGIEPPAGVSEGPALRVVQSDPDAVGEKPRPAP